MCDTHKMAGVGNLALYWARSSLRAANTLMQGFSRPGTQHSCDSTWNTGRAGNCLQRTLGPLWLHSYILWSMLKFFHIKSQHYILCMIYVYKGGGTHTVVCTAHLYSVKHTVVFIWSSWGVKYQATSSLFSLFFQHKFDFFFKNIFNDGWCL